MEQILVEPSKVKGGSISFAGCVQLLGFCTFEACVGIFWPSIMKMRSQYIPEEARSTIMNFFRIPLNIFVCIVLYNVCNLNGLIRCLTLHCSRHGHVKSRATQPYPPFFSLLCLSALSQTEPTKNPYKIQPGGWLSYSLLACQSLYLLMTEVLI